MTCRTCFWWTLGECRKAAPITYPIITRPGDCDRTARPVWPETRPEDYCGDYRATSAGVSATMPLRAALVAEVHSDTLMRFASEHE